MEESIKFNEEDLVYISALQHLIFCERQWALIHLEQIWEESRLTAEGRQLHEKVDASGAESRRTIKIARGVRLRSLSLGLTGIADVVEFHHSEKGKLTHLYPIEYKRGKPKQDLSDAVQLCAQALCLEEMLRTRVPKGAFFYGEIKRRIEIELDDLLRQKTIQYIKRLHELMKEKRTPIAKYEKKCDSCSLIQWCIPKCTNGSKDVNNYMGEIGKWLSEDFS